MFSLGETLSRSDICSRLGIAWTRAAVVRAASEDGYAIMIHEDDTTYANVPDWANKQLTMEGRDDVRGALIEQQDVLIRLFFRFRGQEKLEYLGRVRCVGHAAWSTPQNPARISSCSISEHLARSILRQVAADEYAGARTMQISDRTWRDGSMWLVESELVDVCTQGLSKANAIAMLADAFETLIDDLGESDRRGGVTIESTKPAALAAFVLQRLQLRTCRSLS